MDSVEFIESFFRGYNLDNNGSNVESVQELKIKNENAGNNDFSTTNDDSESILNLDEYYDIMLNTNNGRFDGDETANDQNVGNPSIEQNSGNFINEDDINNILEDNFDINCSRPDYHVKQELIDITTKDATNIEYSMNVSDEPFEKYINVDNLDLGHYLEIEQNNFNRDQETLNMNDVGILEVENSEETNYILETKKETMTAADIDKFLHDINEIVFNEQNTSINTDFVNTPYVISETSPFYYKELNTESFQTNDELFYTKVKDIKTNLGGINVDVTSQADLKLITPNNLDADNVSYQNKFKGYKNLKEIYNNKPNKIENDNWEEYETMSISSRNHNKETSIDDNDSNRSGYNSSDFEFISEKEAKEFGIFNTKNNTKLKIVGMYNENDRFNGRKYRNLPAIDFSYRDTHKIPEEQDFINLFRGGFEARGCCVLENKRTMSSMRVEYELGFDYGYFCGNNVENNIIEQLNNEANESRNKILNMYPDDNLQHKRMRLA